MSKNKKMVTLDGARRPGRPALPLLFLALIARDYVTALRLNLPPVRFVADQRRVSILTARNWIFMCRRRKLLIGRTVNGVASGTLSARAKQLLGESDR